MVVIKERAAEEDHRGEHEIGDEPGGALRGSATAAQKEEEAEARNEVGERQRRQRAERVDVVGAAQLDRASERGAEGRSLDDDHRDDQSDKREPRERGKNEPERKERKGNEGERPGDPRASEGPSGRRRTLGDEHRGPDERDRQQRSGDHDLEHDGVPAAETDRNGVYDADGDAERERTPEVPRVEADGLRNELTDRARLGRQRRRGRLRFPASFTGALLSACHCARNYPFRYTRDLGPHHSRPPTR